MVDAGSRRRLSTPALDAGSPSLVIPPPLVFPPSLSFPLPPLVFPPPPRWRDGDSTRVSKCRRARVHHRLRRRARRLIREGEGPCPRRNLLRAVAASVGFPSATARRHDCGDRTRACNHFRCDASISVRHPASGATARTTPTFPRDDAFSMGSTSNAEEETHAPLTRDATTRKTRRSRPARAATRHATRAGCPSGPRSCAPGTRPPSPRALPSLRARERGGGGYPVAAAVAAASPGTHPETPSASW